MSLNGVKIGMVNTAVIRKLTPKDQPAVPIALCVEVAGTSRLRVAVLPTATLTVQITVVSAAVFGSCFPSKQLGFASSVFLISIP